MSCPAGLDKVKELAKAIGSKTDIDEEKAKAALRQAGLTPNDIKKLVSYYQAAGKQQSLTQIFLDQIDKLGLNQPDKYQVVISKYDQMMAQEVIPGLYESLGWQKPDKQQLSTDLRRQHVVNQAQAFKPKRHIKPSRRVGGPSGKPGQRKAR